MSEPEDINRKIWKLWKDNPREAGSIVPKFVKPPRLENVVFLGLNPSLPKQLSKRAREWIEKPTNTPLLAILNMHQNSDWYPACFYWERSGLKEEYCKKIADAYAEIHYGARDYYGRKWFKRLNEIRDKTNIKSYGHVDLFLCLHASFQCLPFEYHAPQNHVRAPKPNFVQSQLDLAHEILMEHPPKIIIAVYKSAADIFLRYHASVLGCQPDQMLRQCLIEGKLLEKIDLIFDGGTIPFLICSNLPNHRSDSEADKMVKEIVKEIKNCLAFIESDQLLSTRFGLELAACKRQAKRGTS